MGFNFKNTNTKETAGFLPQFISYGVNLLKINHIELKESSTGKYQVKFWMEGPAKGKDFVGAELPDKTKAVGLVGKVNLGIYFALDDNFKVENLTNNLMYIAEKAEVADQVAEIQADTIQDLLEQYLQIIKGKFMWFIVKGEEYDKGKFALSLKEGRIGQDDEGKKIFQVFCKHNDFGEPTELVEERIVKVRGANVVGSSIGKIDILEFNPDYDLKPFVDADDEDDDNDIPASGSEDAPF